MTGSMQDHFSLFGLPPVFAVDPPTLEMRFRALQAEVHPDRYADAGEADRRRAVQWSAQVNEAYQTLRSPLLRAKYLLALRGVDVEIESNTAMPAEFLMAQMEWRELFDDARRSRDLERLEALHDELRDSLHEGYRKLGTALDDGDSTTAAQTVRELMFVDRLSQQVNDALAEIE